MLEPGDRKWLRSVFGDAVRFDAPLAPYTSFKIGGPADALVEPADVDRLKEVAAWSHHRKIPYWVMGGGTNLLVADSGVRGITLRLNRLNAPPTWHQVSGAIRLSAHAGVPTRRLCALGLKSQWQGLNFAVGIPGMIGGAVCMNAGTAAGNMATAVEALDVVDNQGREVGVNKAALAFGYRRMGLPPEFGGDPRAPAIVVRVHIRLSPGDGAVLREQARAGMASRAHTQPLGQATAGSFFKNPAPAMPAGRLIEDAGLKGASVGDAQVSRRHANFIINRGRATAADVLRLKTLIQETVWHRFQISLEPEVRLVGQSQNTQAA